MLGQGPCMRLVARRSVAFGVVPLRPSFFNIYVLLLPFIDFSSVFIIINYFFIIKTAN